MVKKIFFILSLALMLGVFAFGANNANATHSWGGYHWARTANPFTLKLGNNLSASWLSYLNTASSEWSQSTVLDTAVVGGLSNPKNCKPALGTVQVCNSKYGNNGWLGLAQIWVSGLHITQGTTKMNDTYFSKPQYNTAAWKNLVVCQEIAHTFGLDHQDENFSNVNLGTCMDYTNAPAGGVVGNFNYGPSNEQPNAHDYDELSLIYSHLDTTNTSFSTTTNSNAAVDLNDPSAWGQSIRESSDKKTSVFERDLGKGDKLFTFVIWVQGE